MRIKEFDITNIDEVPFDLKINTNYNQIAPIDSGKTIKYTAYCTPLLERLYPTWGAAWGGSKIQIWGQNMGIPEGLDLDDDDFNDVNVRVDNVECRTGRENGKSLGSFTDGKVECTLGDKIHD